MMNNTQTQIQKITPDSSFTWNIPGDVMEKSVNMQKQEFAELLRFFYFYAQEKGWSMTRASTELGVSVSTISRIYTGKYVNGNTNLIISPPAGMISTIRRIKELEKVDIQKKSAGRITTPTTSEIFSVCKKAWQQQRIAFIYGEPQIGKTEALKWFRDENNHGNTIYVDLNGVGGVQDIYKKFAESLKLGESAPNKLKTRIYSAINKRMLVIIDEFHQVTYSYKKSSSCSMVHAIKAIHDICGCGMVICCTDIGRQELEAGHDAKLCSQLLKRGTIQLQLPKILRISDVRAIVEAYGLTFPEEKAGERWIKFKPSIKGQSYCHDIAVSKGINYLVLVLQDANMLAAKEERNMQWKDFEIAHEAYLYLSQEKIY